MARSLLFLLFTIVLVFSPFSASSVPVRQYKSLRGRRFRPATLRSTLRRGLRESISSLGQANITAGVSGSWYRPPPTTSFYIEFEDANSVALASLSTKSTAQVYDVDGFDVQASTVKALKKAGKKVICYFSFGTVEDYTPDASKFPQSIIGAKACMLVADNGACLQYYPEERYIDIRSPIVLRLMEKRIQLAVAKGCDGIDADVVESYQANLSDPKGQPYSKFSFTRADQIKYNRWIGNTVHKYGLSIGLKNCGDLVPSLIDVFDFAIVESCYLYSDYSSDPWSPGKYECDPFNAFILAGKAVFGIEYDTLWASQNPGIKFPQGVCADSNARGFSTREHDFDLSSKYYPSGDCQKHMTSACSNNCYKKCLKPQVLALYNTDPQMVPADKFGECVRACSTKGCPYV